MQTTIDTQRAGELRIGIDGRFLQDKFDGIGRYLYGLLTGLCTLEGEHRLTLFFDSSLPNGRFPLDPLIHTGKLEVYPISIPLYSAAELWGWPGLLRAAQIDLFHSPYIWSPILTPCPVITTFHDMIFDRYPEYIPGRQFWLPYMLMSRFALRKSRRVIAVSSATKSDMVEFAGARPDKIVTILSGVESAFRPVGDAAEQARVRSRYVLPELYILALGARRPHKNIGRLVAAFDRLAAEFPHVLVLAGTIDTRFHDDASRSIAALKARGRLLELGHVAEQDLPVLYSMASLFVQPSLIEGFGLPVAEAMACGCPVACSNTSSLPEVAGDAALFFDPLSEAAIASVLRQTLTSADLRTGMAQRGLRRASQLQWRSTAGQTLDVYRSALGAHTTPQGDEHEILAVHH